MKEKILKAIDKGLMNALSTDITDQDIDFNHDNIDNEYIPYEAMTVDMGTGILWCEYNLGAYPGLKPENWYGNYYAWGETEVKDDYLWENYKHCGGSKDKITKYNDSDRLECLVSKDDVVTQTLGNKFRMPTQNEYEKLIENTANEWVENYKGIHGLNGRLFTAENGNTLFFPAAGYYYGADCQYVGENSCVWTASRDSGYPESAFDLNFGSVGVGVYSIHRYYGFSARGVRNCH